MAYKKFQIFISSTVKDLLDERDVVRDIILSMNQIPISMEAFSAEDKQQWDIIQDHIDNSDYYILIIGERYGSIMPSGISYTEAEFDYAQKTGKNILVFTLDEKCRNSSHVDFPLKLEAFIQKASTGRIRNSWSNAQDLGAKVAVSLYQLLNKNRDGGWIKYDRTNDLMNSFHSEYLKNAKHDIYIIENTLIDYYNMTSLFATLAEKGVKIHLMLLNSRTRFKKNCEDLGANDYHRMLTSVQTVKERMTNVLSPYIGTTVFLKETTSPIWITQTGYDIENDDGYLWSTHLLYDVNPFDCLQIRTSKETLYYSYYKKHLLHSWNSDKSKDIVI